MEQKTRKIVVKSKSSNSAITSKSKSPITAAQNSRNKKSWSSAEFKNKTNKKRGVYVEKKSTNLLNSRGPEDPEQQKPSKRPRKSQKGFLNSVLNILSQDTTGTQYPDVSDLLKPGRHRRIRRRTVETVDKGIQDLDAMSVDSASPLKCRSPQKYRTPTRSPQRYILETSKRFRSQSPQKRKFKSRILNDHASDRFVVLQPRKELNHTPSNQSEGASKDFMHKRKWSDSPLVQYLEEEQKPPKIIHNRDITDGKKLKKADPLKEPATMVNEIKTSTKSLYNFFVDLLETTFSVYNMNAEYETKNKESANVKFEIDEKVAQKLTMSPPRQQTINCGDDNNDIKRDTVFYIRNDDVASDKIEVYKTKPRCANMNPPLRPRTRSPGKTHRSESFSYTQPFRADSPMNRSILTQKKSFQKKKKNKKVDFLNKLKEELRMEDDAFEEPQTMHQALKLIAKNKRRCRRAIRFDESACSEKRVNDDGHPDCMFKRRKVISPSTKSTRRNRLFRIFNPQTTFMQSMRTSGIPRKLSTANRSLMGSSSYACSYDYREDDNKTASCHSIVVEGYDFEPDFTLRQNDTKNKAIIYAYNSTETILTESIGSSKDYLGSIPSKVSTSISQMLLRDPDMY